MTGSGGPTVNVESAAKVPIIAILRAVVPERCVAIVQVLYRAGIRAVEVPVNSPDPFASITRIRAHVNTDCVVGAGTVLSAADVRQTRAAGGQFVVAPNVDVGVIRCALELGLQVIPGFATPTEAFQAIQAGAATLKLFPAATYGPVHLKALKAVLPKSTRIFPVGGIGTQQVDAWLAAGADGFGFGSELFTPAYDLQEIERRARAIVAACRGSGM